MPDGNGTKEKAFINEKLRERGWGTGRPTTEEEESFILDYLQKYGVAPSAGEVARWKQGQDTMSFKFTPESTMGEMGWAGMSLADRERAVSMTGGEASTLFGPYAGREVPMGGTVLTDQFGKPLGRTYDTTTPGAQHFMKTEQYIPTREESTKRLAGLGYDFEKLFGEGDTGKYYPEVRPFKAPTVEEAFKGLSPQQVYRTRYEDYLNQKLQEDTTTYNRLIANWNDIEKERVTKENEIKDANARGEMTDNEASQRIDWLNYQYDIQTRPLNQQISDLLNKDRIKQLLSDADTMIGQGELDELPMIKELAETMGPLTNELYNKILGEMKAEYTKNLPKDIPMGGENVELRTGTEQRDYLSYIERLPVVGGYKKVMKDQFFLFYSLWEGSGENMPFMAWVQNYIARGG